MIPKKCVNGTEQNCTNSITEIGSSLLEDQEALEEIVWNGFKMWHLILFSIMGVLGFVILICCCIKFRIPRTKQEIEADYVRRKILRKFRKRLKAIQNQELDEMDLKKALDKIRSEFKSDTESLGHSDAGFSAATISSTGIPGVGIPGSTYRRASQIQIDISLEELRAQTLGFKTRVLLGLNRLLGRSKVSQSDKVALTMDVNADGETQLNVTEAAGKPKKGDNKKDMEVKKVGKTEDKKKEEKKKEELKKEDLKKEEKAKKKEEKVKIKEEKSTKAKKPNDIEKGTGQGTSSGVKGQETTLKVEDEKTKEKPVKSKGKPEKAKDKPENVKEKPEKPKEKPDKPKDIPAKVKEKPDKAKEKADKEKEKADKAKEKSEKAEQKKAEELKKKEEKSKAKLEKSKEKPKK